MRMKLSAQYAEELDVLGAAALALRSEMDDFLAAQMVRRQDIVARSRAVWDVIKKEYGLEGNFQYVPGGFIESVEEPKAPAPSRQPRDPMDRMINAELARREQSRQPQSQLQLPDAAGTVGLQEGLIGPASQPDLPQLLPGSTATQ